MIELLNYSYLCPYKIKKMATLLILGILGGMGGSEIFIIVFVLLLLFGGKKIPELARGLGKGIREFKDASSGVEKDDDKKELKKPE
jgi:sec-independent protein translocase protein TatA